MPFVEKNYRVVPAAASRAIAEHEVEVIPARCKACDFVFGEEKLMKPSRCPACKGTRLYEPMIRLARTTNGR